MVEYWYNTNYHASSNLTPFEILYGMHSAKLTKFIPSTTRNQVVENNLRSREQILSLLKHNLMAAQERQKVNMVNGTWKRVLIEGIGFT
jgi:hypothetical protein